MSTADELSRQLSRCCWADSGFDEITASYDAVDIRLTDPSGRRVHLRCESHITLHWRGHWNENVLEDVQVTTDAAEIQLAVDDLRQHPSLGGGTRNLAGPWSLLTVSFIDGATVSVVAQHLSVTDS